MNRDFPHQVREKGNSIEIVLPTPATKNIQQHNVSIKWKFMIFINFIFIFCFWLDARDIYTNGYIGNANTIFIPLLEEIWKTNCFQWTLGCRWDNSVFLLAMFCNLMIFYSMLFLFVSRLLFSSAPFVSPVNHTFFDFQCATEYSNPITIIRFGEKLIWARSLSHQTNAS